MQVQSREQRLAIAALVLFALAVLMVVVAAAQTWFALFVAAAGLSVTTVGLWWTVTERMPRRAAGAAVTVAGALVTVGAVQYVAQDGRTLGPWLVVLGLATAAAGCARAALVPTLHRIDNVRTFPPFRPKHPVLICNRRSGGGKVDSFRITERARAAGVEVVMLEPGLDLEQLARDAVARGADCLGMAGGDGSQALVASVAVEHGLPFVCISAGTRNHFALDLGLDRTDPADGLRAFTDGVIRRVDYARIGRRLFVNNVSLGVYARIVQSDDYRDAKITTTASTLPELLSSEAEPFDLQFTAPDGREVDGAFLILVSNNPYILAPRLDAAQRRSVTTGRLGVIAISTATGREAAELTAKALAGLGGLDPNFFQFTATEFEVRSYGGTAEVGIDGEALTVQTPLTFTIHPRGLALLVPSDNPRVTAGKHYRALGIRGPWDVANGRSPRGQEHLL